jgi:ABC-2 type transport system ATP-binding protein
VIEIHELSMRYGASTAVNNLSLKVPSGSLFGLLGPNGAGKTTTIACVCGMRLPQQGSVRVNGVDVSEDPKRVRTMVGYVPQELALYTELTVDQNLSIFGGLSDLAGSSLRKRIDWALEVAQLTDRRRDVVDTLSGGMKRRLNMVSSLLHQPEVIICDEPTTGVDPQSRNHLFDTVRHLHAEGKTVLYTTHYMEEVEALCQRVGIMDRGALIADNSLEQLLDGKESLEQVFLDLTGRGLRDAG